MADSMTVKDRLRAAARRIRPRPPLDLAKLGATTPGVYYVGDLTTLLETRPQWDVVDTWESIRIAEYHESGGIDG